jgi:hypothetical protein
MAESTALSPINATTAEITPTQPAPAAAISNGKTALADALRAHFSGDAPLTEKAKSFAKARPWTSAAFVGIAGLALLNSLRGRR